MASFTATWLKPQLSDSSTMTDAAARSSGRTEGGTIASGRDIPELFPEKWAPVFRRKCDKIKKSASARAAVGAHAGDLDHRRLRREAGTLGSGRQRIGDRGRG